MGHKPLTSHLKVYVNRNIIINSAPHSVVTQNGCCWCFFVLTFTFWCRVDAIRNECDGRHFASRRCLSVGDVKCHDVFTVRGSQTHDVTAASVLTRTSHSSFVWPRGSNAKTCLPYILLCLKAPTTMRLKLTTEQTHTLYWVPKVVWRLSVCNEKDLERKLHTNLYDPISVFCFYR